MFISLFRARCTDPFMQPPAGPPAPSRCDLDDAGGDTLRPGIPTCADSRAGTPRLHPLVSITIEDPRRPKTQIQPIAHTYSMNRQGPRPVQDICRPDSNRNIQPSHAPIVRVSLRTTRSNPDSRWRTPADSPAYPDHIALPCAGHALPLAPPSPQPAGRPEAAPSPPTPSANHALRRPVPRYASRRPTAPGAPRTRSRRYATPARAKEGGLGQPGFGPSISAPLTPLGESSTRTRSVSPAHRSAERSRPLTNRKAIYRMHVPVAHCVVFASCGRA